MPEYDYTPELTAKAREAVFAAVEAIDGVDVYESTADDAVVVQDREVKTGRDACPPSMPPTGNGETCGRFLVRVNTVGTARWSEITDDQGTLLYCKDGVEVSFAGVQTGQPNGILAEVKDNTATPGILTLEQEHTTAAEGDREEQ
jgi:hypothetical protein